MEKKGIAIAGNILTDNVKFVNEFPKKGMLATILDESLAVGGCVPNTAIDIKKLDNDLRVVAYGKIGDDYKGKYVLDKMQETGIEIDNVKIIDNLPTSYSDVITIKETGERTFFHNRGANKEFCIDDIDVESLNVKMFHIGYLMLLDSFDKLLEDGSTPMSKLLKKVQERGIKTSIDIVSESSGNFYKIVNSALAYCDYVIINEIEAGEIAQIPPRNEDYSLNCKNIRKIMQKLMQMGNMEKLVVHCPEKGFSLNNKGEFFEVDSIKLPKGFIKGSVGAGDAFCAGCLYAIYNGYSDNEMLSFANLVAINCLSQADSISGICDKDNLMKVLNNK